MLKGSCRGKGSVILKRYFLKDISGKTRTLKYCVMLTHILKVPGPCIIILHWEHFATTQRHPASPYLVYEMCFTYLYKVPENTFKLCSFDSEFGWTVEEMCLERACFSILQNLGYFLVKRIIFFMPSPFDLVIWKMWHCPETASLPINVRGACRGRSCLGQRGCGLHDCRQYSGGDQVKI